MLNNTKAFSFLGTTSQQQFADLIVWEVFFQQVSVKSMVELGTGRGGMAMYFQLMAIQKNFKFRTYDNDPRIPVVLKTPLASLVNIHYRSADVFAEKLSIVHEFVHPVVLFCDDGDKPREMKEYSPYLVKGDYLAVHDFGREVFEDDFPAPTRFERFMWGECLTVESITRFFKVI